MADDKGAGTVALIKDISAIVRDLFLTLTLAICIIFPSTIKTFLTQSGLGKLSIFGVSVELREEKEKIAVAQKQVAEKIASVSASSNGETPVEAKNLPVDPEFKQAVLAAERVAPQVLPTAGWVFLGRVNNARTQWAENSTITNATWPISLNDVLTVKDDVYIRAITEQKWHSSAPVTSVAKVGDQLKVVELDYSPAKAGGQFVWAKVAINSR